MATGPINQYPIRMYINEAVDSRPMDVWRGVESFATCFIQAGIHSSSTPPNHLPWNFKVNSQGIGVTVRRKWRLRGWEKGVWCGWIPAWMENGANGANGSAALHTSKRLSSSSVSYSTWKGNHPEKKNITSFINRLTDFTYFLLHPRVHMYLI